MPKNPHADFTPSLEGYTGQGAFRFWCQMALPLTYDDSLSYYELLCKVIKYLNNVITDVSAVEDNVDALADAYTQLQNYVNNYFDELDIEAELRNVLDAMALDGTLDALLSPIVKNQLPGVVDDQIYDVVAQQIDGAVAGQIDGSVANQLPTLVQQSIPGEVTDWLNDNVTPVGSAVAVDASLSIGGAAADAEVTGYELKKLKDAFTEYNVLNIIERRTNVNWLSGDGLSVTTGTWDIIKSAITPGIKYYFVNPYSGLSANAVRFADASNNYLGTISGFSSLINIPENSAFVYVKCPAGSFPFAVSETYYSYYAKGFKRSLIETYVEEAETAINTANEAKETVNDLNAQLSKTEAAFVDYNILDNIIERQTNVNWLSGDGLSVTTGTWDIIKSAITPGIKYYFVNPYSGLSANAVRFADASNNYLGTISGFSSLINIPENSAFVYVKCPAGSFPFAVSETYYSYYAKGFKRSLIETYVEEAETAINTANEAKETVETLIIDSDNLADRSKFTPNHYMTNTGVIGASNTYYYTNKINVSEGDVIYMSPSPRYTTAFNGDEVVNTTISNPWTVPSGVNGLIITGYMSSIDSLMVSRDKALPYIPYGNYVNNDYLRIDNQNAINGNDGVTLTSESLNANTTMEIASYPKALATHDRLNGYCEFSTLGEIEFGYGYPDNYTIKIDDTNIYKYYEGNIVGSAIAHGLTISDYLSFTIIMNDDRVATITINTTSGNASTTINLNYNKNGLPFLRSSTPLTNVKLSAISADIRKPIWWFGDSYSSNAAERIIGQLSNYNVVGNMLINAVPGMRSYNNESTGAYVDLVKLINLAKPKYIIWAIGMNDTEANYKAYLLRVKNICETFGVTLYATKVPSVPNIDNTGKSDYIDTLGIKSIDWAKAVNATSTGIWYSGFLSTDNVHPSIAGAQAMAAKTLNDCPAIMQFN